MYLSTLLFCHHSTPFLFFSPQFSARSPSSVYLSPFTVPQLPLSLQHGPPRMHNALWTSYRLKCPVVWVRDIADLVYSYSKIYMEGKGARWRHKRGEERGGGREEIIYRYRRVFRSGYKKTRRQIKVVSKLLWIDSSLGSITLPVRVLAIHVLYSLGKCHFLRWLQIQYTNISNKKPHFHRLCHTWNYKQPEK